MNSYLNYTRSVLLRRGEVPDRSRRPAERRRLPSGPDRRAARLVPQSAPSGRRRAARRLLLPDLRRGDRRARPRPARPRDGGRLPLREPDLRGLRSPAEPPHGRLRADPLRDRRPRGSGRLRGDVDGVQRVQHPGGVPGGEPARPHRAVRADPRLRRPRALPRRHGHPAGPPVLPRGRPAHEQHRTASFRAVGALRRAAGQARRHAGEPGHSRGTAGPLQGLRYRRARRRRLVPAVRRRRIRPALGAGSSGGAPRCPGGLHIPRGRPARLRGRHRPDDHDRRRGGDGGGSLRHALRGPVPVVTRLGPLW